MSRKSNLPPIAVLVSEDKITVADLLTGRVVSVDPHDKNFQSNHPAAAGLWCAAYAAAERTNNHD